MLPGLRSYAGRGIPVYAARKGCLQANEPDPVRPNQKVKGEAARQGLAQAAQQQQQHIRAHRKRQRQMCELLGHPIDKPSRQRKQRERRQARDDQFNFIGPIAETFERDSICVSHQRRARMTQSLGLDAELATALRKMRDDVSICVGFGKFS